MILRIDPAEGYIFFVYTGYVLEEKVAECTAFFGRSLDSLDRHPPNRILILSKHLDVEPVASFAQLHHIARDSNKVGGKC